jgi:hypothetical protein
LGEHRIGKIKMEPNFRKAQKNMEGKCSQQQRLSEVVKETHMTFSTERLKILRTKGIWAEKGYLYSLVCFE